MLDLASGACFRERMINCFAPKLFGTASVVYVMVSVLASSAEGRGFDPRPGQTKDFKIGISCLSDNHAALRSKSKDWSARSQKNVSG